LSDPTMASAVPTWDHDVHGRVIVDADRAAVAGHRRQPPLPALLRAAGPAAPAPQRDGPTALRGRRYRPGRQDPAPFRRRVLLPRDLGVAARGHPSRMG